MKKVLIFFALVFAIDLSMIEAAAQDPSTQAAAAQAQASQPQPEAVPALAPAIKTEIVQIPSQVAPPQWATDLLAVVSGLPLVGPYVSKILLWLGILAAILTSLSAAALTVLAALKTGFSAAGLDGAVQTIQAFRNGKVMYWLLYFSNFNVPPKAQV